jgi:hypothetical protein
MLIGAIMALAAGASAGRDCGLAKNPTITGEGIGAMRIGAFAREIKKLCRVVSDSVEPDDEANPQRTIRVKSGSDLFAIRVDHGRVGYITVFGGPWTTGRGIGVGSLLSKLFALPQLEGGEGEGALYAFSSVFCGLASG